ncbi:hypothetical protein LTR09_011859 [Extremus antarcticus]|uniref:Uncharacterized protein n=1 Tax=Extremus antarcticus TaxID=702011 RepID=A0AAJ0DB49_9PEZI|nr:hypothetical protein LTR09_011859 [Extremus antarcticus]
MQLLFSQQERDNLLRMCTQALQLRTYMARWSATLFKTGTPGVAAGSQIEQWIDFSSKHSLYRDRLMDTLDPLNRARNKIRAEVDPPEAQLLQKIEGALRDIQAAITSGLDMVRAVAAWKDQLDDKQKAICKKAYLEKTGKSINL